MEGWKSVWNNRKPAEIIEENNLEQTFLYLKGCMGVTSSNPASSTEFLDQFRSNLAKLKKGTDPSKPLSFFEIGCGSAPYLYYLAKEENCSKLGGIDYSVPLIDIAKKIMCPPHINTKVSELYCSEAIEMGVTEKYDCVYSRSVFQYFPGEEYGLKVAQKMLDKANNSVGIYDLFDCQKKEDFLSYRRSVIENYDSKYADTPHQFYSKEDFIRLADENNCDVVFSRDALNGYWNEPFVFDVYLYKRH